MNMSSDCLFLSLTLSLFGLFNMIFNKEMRHFTFLTVFRCKVECFKLIIKDRGATLLFLLYFRSHN